MSEGASKKGDNLERPLDDGIIPERMVTKTERRWFWVVTLVLGVIVSVITVTGLSNNLHPPSNAQTINPARVYQTREFSENNLGTSVAPDGAVIVRMIAQQYSFVPSCVSVPLGSPVTFRVTSADVIHGFLVAGTNINTMVVPGYISDVRGTFPAAGTYRMPCHEFCGLGHAGMAAEIRVIPAEQFPHMTAVERTSCAAQ